MEINSYSSPFNLGHKALENLWVGTVYVQAKKDGSQFSFSVGTDGVLRARSRGRQLSLDKPDKLFELAVQTVVELNNKGLLTPGYTYRSEAICRPKHNTLCYNRIPIGGLILFDVDKGDQDYMLPDELKAEADRLGLECVPLLATYMGKPTLEEVQKLLDTESVLGGTKVEGVVFKNYAQFGPDKKILMAKLVSEQFKETNRTDFKQRNPGKNDIIQNIIEMYGTEARYRKAVQHLRESGQLQEAPQDIPNIMHEVQDDILKECGDEIKDMLFSVVWKKDISRGLVKGIPEWWKAQLAESMFS
jgi:hypothetical protein